MQRYLSKLSVVVQLCLVHRAPVISTGFYPLSIGLARKALNMLLPWLRLFSSSILFIIQKPTAKPNNQYLQSLAITNICSLISQQFPLWIPSFILVFIISLPHFQTHLQLRILFVTFLCDEYSPNTNLTYIVFGLSHLFSFKIRM